RTWKDAYELAPKLKISGLSSGLTRMQFAHNLAFLALVSAPTAEDMIEVLCTAEHREKGAVGALVRLGLLSSPIAPVTSIREAYIQLYNHIDQHLRLTSKDLILWQSFSHIIFEHLLCKIVKWWNALI
ncbi:hypothetical protein C8J56DRAFT_1120627, partial [Mycena floridula]